MDLVFSPWLVWFLAGIAVMLAELAVPAFVIVFFLNIKHVSLTNCDYYL